MNGGRLDVRSRPQRTLARYAPGLSGWECLADAVRRSTDNAVPTCFDADVPVSLAAQPASHACSACGARYSPATGGLAEPVEVHVPSAPGHHLCLAHSNFCS